MDNRLIEKLKCLDESMARTHKKITRDNLNEIQTDQALNLLHSQYKDCLTILSLLDEKFVYRFRYAILSEIEALLIKSNFFNKTTGQAGIIKWHFKRCHFFCQRKNLRRD